MAATEGRADCGKLLPRELLEVQLAQIDLLMAMYPAEESITISDTSSATLEILRRTIEADSDTETLSLPFQIDLVLQLDIETPESTVSRTIQLSVSFPLHSTHDVPVDPPPARLRLHQPSWLNKSDTASIASQIPEDEDLLAAIEATTDAVSAHISQSQEEKAASPSQPTADTALSRVWFYFPSISTRSKRDDLVNHAPTYGLTGFLLAGKPGILCLEGGSQAVDDFMKFIKTESWGDIPAHHKKVSERYRQNITERAFSGMEEITDQLERRGERANRNDMKALEAWLGERGLQEAFAKVLI